jgi:hypothetical protein
MIAAHSINQCFCGSNQTQCRAGLLIGAPSKACGIFIMKHIIKKHLIMKHINHYETHYQKASQNETESSTNKQAGLKDED